ncbi:C40 family peptidase [Streptomyces sp. NBC_01549]|uniref:C40 family peptidase n=1 Tax=Streptomyces sp. NBC_01549 TaxID=2975874 RepID=UPI0022511AA6|nr:C40 family peptidase [Streptomyces sp. NBC_01549]MCX4595810.1 C40 family peptidase [Streptomyces sp. NBC_01549]
MPDSARAAALNGADGPSREEVQQRISSLYDQAENAVGFVNGTRAMTTGSRGRGNPTPETARRRSDPALDDITKTWFDAARSRLGPSAPARLPADRMPDPPAARPASPARRPEDGLTNGGRELTARPVLELTAGPAAEAAAGPVAELTARAVAALPPAPQPVQQAAAALLPALPAGPGQSSLKTSKEKIQRKLALAREVVSKHAAQWNPGPATIESRPAEVAWPAPQDQARHQAAEEWQRQQPTALGPDMSLGAGMPLGRDMSMGAGMLPVREMSPGANTPLTADIPMAAGMPPGPNMSNGAGIPLTADMSLGAGMPPAREMSPGANTPLTADIPMAAGMPPGADVSLGAGMTVGTGASIGAVYMAGPVGMVGASESGYGGKAAKALAFARAQIGKPCVWGATGPDSYDSSSLTQAAWRAAGVALPRTVHGQATAGTAIPLTDIQFGDLIFFHDNVSHVGFYTGNGMMIHAPSPGASIREESIFFAGQKAIHSALRPA